MSKTRRSRLLLPLALGWLVACGGADDGGSTQAVLASADRPAAAAPVTAAPLTAAPQEQPKPEVAQPSAESPSPAATDAAAAPAADAAPVAPAPVAANPTAQLGSAPAAAGTTTPAPKAGGAWAPKTLDTGFDLSSIQVGAVAPPPPVAASKGRLAVVDGTAELDLGALVQGEVIQRNFVLENQGEGPIVVSGTHNSCGCTVSSTSRVAADGTRTPFVYGEAVDVGQRIEIAVKVDTQSKKGAITNTITLQTDAAQPAYLQIRAQVEPLLLMTPETYLTLQPMRSDEQQSAEFSVRSSTGQPFRLEVDGAGLPAFVHVALEPVEPVEGERAAAWKGKVTVGPGVPEGLNQGWPLMLVSDVPAVGKDGAPALEARMHRASTYVVAQEVSGLVRVTPAHLSFGLMRPGQTVTRSVRIESLDEAFALPAELPVRLVDRDDASQAIVAQCVRTSVAAVDGGRAAELTVTISDVPEDFQGVLGGGFEIDVGHPSKPVVNVLFTAVCRPTIHTPSAPPAPSAPTANH